MTIRQKINEITQNRILVLDGVTGSLLKSFDSEKNSIDNLCLINPHIISDIHNKHLEAGTDIIETCSFYSTSVELEKFGLQNQSYEISFASARIARECANRFSSPDKPRFVAGCIGPTSKSASLGNIAWGTLDHAYYDNARGLLDGGADILILDAAFDTLNVKAAIYAISWLMIEREIDIPVIISASVTDDGDHLLSRQTLEAFILSIMHINPLAIGINNSNDSKKLFPPTNNIIEFLKKQNTPSLVMLNSENNEENKQIKLAGLEPLYLKNEEEIFNIISKIDQKEMDMFRKELIDGEFENAAKIARKIIDFGATILPIEIDDERIMNRFLDYAMLDLHLAKYPFFLKSTNLAVLETGLRRLQGISIAGPVLHEKVQLIRRYGAHPILAV